MDLSRFPRRRYTPFATPVEPLPRFSAALAATCPGGAGPQVWIKRDDMLGLFPGGNKTRKLEFLVADALAQGADTLITCGAPQLWHKSHPTCSATFPRNRVTINPAACVRWVRTSASARLPSPWAMALRMASC
jgi:hypothetical protein